MHSWLDRAGRNIGAALVRAVRTALQTAVASLGVGQVTALDWQQAAALAASAGLVSLLTGLVAALPEVETAPKVGG